MTLLALTVTLSTASHANFDGDEIEKAFECSNYAMIASRTAPSEDSQQLWVTHTKEWLENAYRLGGSIYDYIELPEHISKKFAGLYRHESFAIAKDEYGQLGCDS